MDQNLNDRVLQFAVQVGVLCRRLPQDRLGQQVADQLIRSGTSAGPNYEEACAAESRKDFIHKMSICLKELRESRFWLKLVVAADLAPEVNVSRLQDECSQLCKIFGKSIVTARKNDPAKKAWRDHRSRPTDH